MLYFLMLTLPVISYDIWFYISHVMLHSRYLNKYHHIHHVAADPNWIDTYVSHWTEGPFQGAGLFFPYLFYKYTLAETLLILAFVNIRGMMRHDKRWTWLIGNHHLLHHAHGEYNFGEYWMDSLLGTRYPVSKEYRYGLVYI